MTSTRSTLHSISTTPLTSPHAFVHVILIKIHFSLHFQSASECIPIPYHTVRPPKRFASSLFLGVYLYIRTTETNGGRYMYLKHVLSDNTLLNSPRDLSCWKRNFPPGIQKDFFGGFGLVGFFWVCQVMYAFIGCAPSDRKRCRHTLLYLPT